MAGYIFYDLECTGLSPAHDVPVQAALIRTDEHLVVVEELVVRARVPDHVVPAPDALVVTGLRPGDLTDAPLSQTQMLRDIAAFIAKAAPAVIMGYNTLAYDEEILRAALFQNLLPPYPTSLDGNRRADVLTMTKAIAALTPGAIRIPEKDGRQVFRLGEVCRANAIDLDEDAAHDALNDIRATIALFRLLRERAPDLVASFMENADKRSVQRRLDAGGVFGLVAFGKIVPMAALMTSPTNPSSLALADLRIDPASWLDRSQAELSAALASRGERPVRTVKLNAQPMLLPWTDVHDAAGCDDAASALLPLAQDAFTETGFVERYEAGQLVFVYACGCGQDHRNPTVANGLLGVAKRLYACLHKVSVTGQAHIRSRLRELNHHRYGCQTISEDGFPCSDRGFDNWIAQLILPLEKPLEGSPVRVGGSSLEVRLPADLSTEEFEERLHKHMRNASLNEWLDTPEGQTHCQQIGRNPDEFRRLTGYGFDTETRVSTAKEFYFFRPKSRDADRLVRIAEVIVHEWVTNPASRQLVSFKCKGQGYYGLESAKIGLGAS